MQLLGNSGLALIDSCSDGSRKKTPVTSRVAPERRIHPVALVHPPPQSFSAPELRELKQGWGGGGGSEEVCKKIYVNTKHTWINRRWYEIKVLLDGQETFLDK